MDDTHSIFRNAFLLPGGPTSRQPRSQSAAALSTMKAEYTAAAPVTQEAFWPRFLLEEMGFNVRTPYSAT